MAASLAIAAAGIGMGGMHSAIPQPVPIVANKRKRFLSTGRSWQWTGRVTKATGRTVSMDKRDARKTKNQKRHKAACRR